ncbi:putative DsbA family dithiol-disulfide isomerase [Kineococcus xinjiangensis]|uniref:Putative DsbA family dithiol-disulfide isomerase n=1 Tax=Kineococcus xinjiangensis TaxID=512762 RepID=A0A2S6ITE0_9ACTN|nr:DsbA family oxidoreductase [Kineococcus xinjiangensis]PPK97509.1 putative DsbA family dithiol-disulfide isomerase [Kineococcus xinjiangensis]
MKVEIWSDVVCPWCYIGKRRFEAALARFEHRDDVEVEWKAFELDPSAESADASAGGDDYARRLAAKYGTSVEQARQMLDSMTAAAAEEGLDFHFERAVRANTADAHQVILLAAGHGLQDAVKERLLRAYFTEGAAVGVRDVLVDLAAEAGLDREEVRAALAEDRHLAEVRAEEAEAAALGVRGVPFFVVDRRYGVSGAQPAEHLLAVLQRAWEESRPLTVVGADTAAGACGPDGCSI